DLRLPDRLLQDRPVVVRPHLRAAFGDAHDRTPQDASAVPTAVAADAIAPLFHIDGRSFVVTTGSGGRPYTSGSSSSRKNAPKPPTPSSGSRPYSCAPFQSCSCSLASRSPR